MQEQFFGKFFWVSLIGILVTMILGFLAFGNILAVILTISSAIVAFVLTWKNVEHGLLFAFAELFSTSHGHLVSMQIGGFSFSMRMAIFAGVMVAWTIQWLTGRTRLELSLGRKQWDLWPWALLGVAILLGFIIGFLNNPALDVFKDGNAYGYLAYLLPIISVPWDALKRQHLLQIFAGSAAAVSVVTFSLLYTYTHMPEPILRAIYTFVRDTRIAELTRIAGDIFRIFLQAQFSILVMLFLFSSSLIVFWKRPRERAIIFYGLTLCLSILIISLSRSFWIGILAGGLVFTILVLKRRLWSFHEAIYFMPTKILIFLSSLAVLWIVIAFPVPPPADISVFGDILKERTTEIDDSAISSRWNLLPEMMAVIGKDPIIGNGFGTKVAFKSDDPRVRAIYPDGKWRTYSFEWGWFDAWLKMGFLGPIALLWIGYTLIRGLRANLKEENGWISLGLLCSLIALYVIHIFSPYLNHPIGIGFLLFLLPFIHRPTLPISQQKVYESKNPSILRVATRPLDPASD